MIMLGELMLLGWKLFLLAAAATFVLMVPLWLVVRLFEMVEGMFRPKRPWWER